MKQRAGGEATGRGAVALGLAAAALAAFAAAGGQTAQPEPEAAAQPRLQLPWSGDRTMPVHLFQLRDELDQLIVPNDPRATSFSARYTCGPCHDYDTVAGGWHFNAPRGGPAGRPGQPWFEMDAKTGTVLPLSYRGWPGTWDPRRAELSEWAFTLLFGRHLPGGGPAEPGPEALADPAARWNVSGAAEVNCLACHSASNRQDASEWAKQIARHNLRWAATAASGLGEVGGMASRLRETWDIYDGPNPDDHEWAVAPSVKYDAAEFDSRHRVFMDLNYVPDSERCLACHSTSPAGEAHWTAGEDVHAAAGLRCADCHRNDLGHAILRGYEGEDGETGRPEAAAFTCRGCHLGENSSGEEVATPGRLGAPYPRHPGLPVVHLERLSCTACHSGAAAAAPAAGLTRVRTSRAHRLGIHGVAQWWTDTPAIVEPVFVRGGDGRLGPRRVAWPAFWAEIDGGGAPPLRPESVLAAAGGLLNCEERLAAVLTGLALACEEGETPVLVANGFVFALNVDGGLDAAAAGEVPEGLSWGLRKDGRIAPLLPDFDPDDPEKDPEIEPRLQLFLEALAVVPEPPGTGVFVMKSTLYQLQDGFLNAGPIPETAAGAAPGFGWLRDGAVIPLGDEYDVRTVAAKAGREQTLTEEQVRLVLKALAAAEAKSAGRESAAAGKAFGYISGGRLFRLNAAGELTAASHPAAEAVTWPLAHDVRPAQAALGWNGCQDCHSAGSRFFFERVEAAGPLLTARVERRAAHSFMGLSGLFQRLFGLTFAVRPALKTVLLASAFLAGALLLLAFLTFLGRVSGLLPGRPERESE